MASLIDMLLSVDTERLLERPTTRIGIARLDNIIGGKFVLELQALTKREFDELPKGEDAMAHMILRSVTNFDFGNQELASRLRPKGRNTPLTPVEVLRKLFLPGELNSLEKHVLELSGFGENLVEKIEKN